MFFLPALGRWQVAAVSVGARSTCGDVLRTPTPPPTLCEAAACQAKYGGKHPAADSDQPLPPVVILVAMVDHVLRSLNVRSSTNTRMLFERWSSTKT
jgi:hypothetical protein